MNKNRQRIVWMLILALVAVVVTGCTTILTANTPDLTLTPVVVIIAPPNPAFALAQATIDSGQSQLSDLSGKATQVSLNMALAAKDAAQSTQAYNQKQKANLDYQATIISLNMAQAASTQKSIEQQTKIAVDAAAAAQNSTATAAQAAYLANVTETAQVQATQDAQANQTAQAVATLTAYPLMVTAAAQAQAVTQTAQAVVVLNAQATQSAQAVASLTAFPLTATPFAVTQAALLMQEYGREQQAFTDQVVTPLLPIAATVFLILLVLGIIYAYRRFLPMRRSSRWSAARARFEPIPLMVGPDAQAPRIIPYQLNPVNSAQQSDENPVHVEIVNPAEPPFAHWIEEIESQLGYEGELSQ